MEKKVKDKITLVWIVSQKYTLLQLWHLGIIAKWPEELSSFHRKQLRRVIGIKWPHRITNKKLYQVTETESVPITINGRRWKLLGNILRLTANCPARWAMRYYFEERTNKKFLGRRRAITVTPINEDIRRKREKHTHFPNRPLISLVSLQSIHTKAKNRMLWQKLLVK